jgi:ABC-type antimicrobial peptide transport system permease subunit
MRSRIDESLASRRIPLMLLSVFAAVALFLAVIGIYGALAYSVTQRRREIGIRMAMGSGPRGEFWSVVLAGLRVTGLGLAVGVVAALLLMRLMESLLFGVEAADPRVMVVVALLLATVAFAACVIPARRATRVSPAESLTT